MKMLTSHENTAVTPANDFISASLGVTLQIQTGIIALKIGLFFIV